MDEKLINSDGYKYLIDKFSFEKISGRFSFVYDYISDFIEMNKYTDRAFVSIDILNHVIIDYFVDIARLKEFQEIEYTNKAKIFSYLSYWLIRHKPIQVIGKTGNEDLVFINEYMVTNMLLSILFTDPYDIPISISKKESVDEFKKMIFYYLKYREVSPKALELMIVAFNAGRGYQFSADFIK